MGGSVAKQPNHFKLTNELDQAQSFLTVTKSGSARASRGAAGGASRPSRRREETRGPEWVRPYRRAQRALDVAAKLIRSTMHLVITTKQCAKKRPMRTARRIIGAVRQMDVASMQLDVARRAVAEAKAALAQDPSQQRGEAPEIMDMVTERYEAVALYIPVAVAGAIFAQAEILGGLSTGELVPERPSDVRPRIVITPRPLFVRAFLVTRQPRVSDRITPVLLRRRRTPRPAEVQVPRPDVQGRAPPLSSTCTL
jgi:hypothetical protein